MNPGVSKNCKCLRETPASLFFPQQQLGQQEVDQLKTKLEQAACKWTDSDIRTLLI